MLVRLLEGYPHGLQVAHVLAGSHKAYVLADTGLYVNQPSLNCIMQVVQCIRQASIDT